jgi:hypothetical protein
VERHRARAPGALASDSVVAGRWQGAIGELAQPIGRATSKVVGGGAHPSGDAT